MSSILQGFSVSNVFLRLFSLSKRLLSTIYCRLYRTFHTLLIVQVLWTVYYNVVAFAVGNMNVESKTHWQSDICRDILRRKHLLAHWKSSLLWALFYFLLCVVLLYDLRTESILKLLLGYSDTLWYLELFLIVAVFSNACCALWLHAWVLHSKPLPLSPLQLKLFGINKSSPGFLVKQEAGSPVSSKESKLLFSPSHRSMSMSPLNSSENSWADSSSSSWQYYQPFLIQASTPKQKASYMGILSKSADESVLIRNSRQLEEFLSLCEDDERKIKSMSFEDAVSILSTSDSSPLSVLSKSRYKRACRLDSMDPVESDSLETHFADVLNRLRISEKRLTSWCERLRRWISQTILARLVSEIEQVNNSLCQMSLPEYQIGAVDLFSLHQVAAAKSQQLRSVSSILPYLDMHLNQEYLVKRLKDLARGGCLSEYRWSAGGCYGEKLWCEDLPTDSAIVLHLLCCYLDALLPPEPHFPGGRPFSSKYFRKAPEKLAPHQDACFIYQSSVLPPHFKVAIGQDVFSLPKGRNNLFHALLIFFHHFKTKESGMLGRVNLGPSGLNLLWVFD